MEHTATLERSNSRLKIWVNAAPFGFGPAAIVFNLFTQLGKLTARDGGERPLVEYVGSGLSLDFNAGLAWDSVHNIDFRESGGEDKLVDLYHVHSPALVIGVLDIPFAEILIRSGATVVIVDSLLWYWDSIWDIYKSAALLICPDFVTVREIARESGLENMRVVPGMMPMAPIEVAGIVQRKGTLVNLGGLQTPLSSLAENVKYARSILTALQVAIQHQGDTFNQPLIALTSLNIQRELQSEFPFIQTVDPSQARRLLRSCRTAFMTSGIGNIFDAVDYGDKVAFIPAICKSHGLQLELLARIGARPCIIDWQDIIEDKARLDYNASDPSCFKQVEEAQAEFLSSIEAQRRLIQLFTNVLKADSGNTSSLQCIPRVLGRADADVLVRCIAEQDLGFELSEE